MLPTIQFMTYAVRTPFGDPPAKKARMVRSLPPLLAADCGHEHRRWHDEHHQHEHGAGILPTEPHTR
jgi:hypothetical protein